MSQRRQGFARRLRPNLAEDSLQGLDPRRQRIAIVGDRGAQQPRERGGFFVG